MSVKYTPEYNQEIRRRVYNYNRRITRAEELGIKNLPNKVKVRELKSLYSDRDELNKELSRLDKLTRERMTNRSNKKGGARALDWQFDLVKANIAPAKEYFKNEYKRVNKRTLRYPGEKTYLNTIKSKINFLNKDINKASESQFRSILSAVTEFINSPRIRKERYRGFLSEVEWVMDQTGISESEREKFFKKFEELTPSQFLYAYDNNDIINKIYSLYRKDSSDGVPYLNDAEDPNKLIRRLLREADDIVNDAKMNSL